MPHFKALIFKLLFALGFLLTVLPVMAEKVVDAAKAGAVGDGTTLNTVTIQKAIDDCSTAGGCTLRFPAGRYLTGTIQLKSKVTLRLEKDATLLGSTDKADYRNLDPFTDGSGNPMGYALVVAVDADKVGIEGSGTIDGQSPQLKAKQDPYTMRPFLVRAVRCTNVTVKDVNLTNPGAWTLNFFQTKDIVIENVTIRSRGLGMPNNDGINIDSSENVRVHNCDVISGDDALVIKSTSASKPSRNIVATDSKLSTRTNAIKLGTESIGGFENIKISNIQITNTQMAGIALYEVDGGNLSNVTISDVTMDSVIVPISIRLGARLKTFREGDRPMPTAGRLHDVTIENVKAKNVEMIGMLINGVPGYPVEALTLKNIELELPGGGMAEAAKIQLPEKESAYPEFDTFGKVMPVYGIYARHVRGMKFQNVRTSVLKPDARPATAFIDVEGTAQVVELRGDASGKRFDGIGIVNGGGATSVLLKDYPEPQRSQILDMVFKPNFGASVSALLVEIPGDGNSTQGSMPSHMHTRDDLDYSRGYTWWILREAKKRNPRLTLDGAAWSAPGWIGNGEFWSQDAADYYVKWLQGLRKNYGLEFEALGVRNERGVNLEFVKMLRSTLDAGGFEKVKIHAFDNWPADKFDFVKEMLTDEKLRDAIDILGAHTLQSAPASAEIQEMAAKMNKPIWNTEEHVYKKGFDSAISIVEAFNENFIRSGATKIVNWYDIAGVYPIEPYSEDPAMILARSPWSGNYQVREALWGYAHYAQFTQAGWQYLDGGFGELTGGGTFVTLKAPGNDYSVIIETKDAKAPQQMRFEIGGGLSGKELCVWRSNAKEQFIRQPGIKPVNGAFTLTLEPDSIYSLSTATGQQKGSFDNIPAPKPFPFPFYETFEEYPAPEQWGYLPRYTADIAGAFEIAGCPGKKGKCLRQAVPVPTLSWAPDWLPYTILGDDRWQNYEISVDVYLNPGESAAVMGRVSHVGNGWDFTPKGYFLELGDDGQCRLVVIRGQKNKDTTTGDAEQQALIKAGKDVSEGGEKVLGTVRLANIKPNQWHNLKLRFDGTSITALVDEKPILSTTDKLYSQGMAGLLAGSFGKKLSTSYFDNLLIKGLNSPTPAPASTAPGQSPIYDISDSRKSKAPL